MSIMTVTGTPAMKKKVIPAMGKPSIHVMEKAGMRDMTGIHAMEAVADGMWFN
jgi:hypothetical protein